MRMTRRLVAIMIIAAGMGTVSHAVMADEDDRAEKKRPPELGAIDWSRDFDAALARAKQENKPVLVLFQEVPGCGTCTTYGDVVLSHPLIRDAAESLFVPVAIYNNVGGDDAQVLKSFKEPAWNNPVVRIIRHDRTMLANRVAGDYSASGLVGAMIAALEKEKREVPGYLRLLGDELAARRRGLEKATFAMYCFWEGEKRFGGLDGVFETMPGFVKGKEVVDVYFDPKQISFLELAKEARRVKCADMIFTRSDAQQEAASQAKGLKAERTDEASRPDKAPKYFLSKSPLRFVPMTATQAARANAAVATKGDARSYLSPSQLRILAAVEAKPDAGWTDAIAAKDLKQAFAAAERTAARVAEGVARR